MDIIATLTLAHLLADFPLQTNSIAFNKSRSINGLFIHVLIYMATNWALLGFEYRLWMLIGGLGASHLLVDYIKLKGDSRSVPLFILDQIVHIAFILLIGGKIIPLYGSIRFALPMSLLYPSLTVASLLAVMVLFWLWANNLQDEQVKYALPVRWGRKRLLELEQRTGFGLLCILGIGAMLFRQ